MLYIIYLYLFSKGVKYKVNYFVSIRTSNHYTQVLVQ